MDLYEASRDLAFLELTPDEQLQEVQRLHSFQLALTPSFATVPGNIACIEGTISHLDAFIKHFMDKAVWVAMQNDLGNELKVDDVMGDLEDKLDPYYAEQMLKNA
ncbi:hypothetical protein HDV00_011255 [Rhizophlyctis rosea]|nr:hypothetical protein HDV00_011255 [Rhizophlyctis rosea]